MKTQDYFNTLLAKFLFSELEERDIKVFKQEKPPKIELDSYIVVNCLPIDYTKPRLEFNMNVNIHTGTLSVGVAQQEAFNALVDEVGKLIPFEDGVEKRGLVLDRSEFFIQGISAPMKDGDETYFVNVEIKVYS